jgi:hypothetical protein
MFSNSLKAARLADIYIFDLRAARLVFAFIPQYSSLKEAYIEAKI